MKARASIGSAALLVAALLSMGPAPGETGGCGDGVQRADAREYCVERGAWLCARARARGEITSIAQEEACVGDVQDGCGAVPDWPLDCRPRPTEREARACIDALKKKSNLERDIADIEACRLCGVPASERRDAGMPEPEDGGMMTAEDAGADEDASASDGGDS